MTTLTSEPRQWPLQLFDPATFRVPERKIQNVFILCTCWDSLAFRGEALAAEINRWHEAEGWHGINWNYLIDKDGNVIECRPLEEAPTIDNSVINGTSIAIAVHGLWHFTTLQLTTLKVLCIVIDSAYNLESSHVTFHGLEEIRPEPNPTFDYMFLLGLDAEGRMGVTDMDTPEAVAERATFFLPLGSRNEQVHSSSSDTGRDTISSLDG
jgi:hypothetical protein